MFLFCNLLNYDFQLRIMNLNQITRFEKSEAGAKFAIIPSIEKGSIQSLQSFLEYDFSLNYDDLCSKILFNIFFYQLFIR